MRYRTLGRTGLKISRVGFGAGQLKPLNWEEAVSMLCRVIEEGINYIDIDKQNDESLVADAIKKTKKNIILSMKSFARTESEMTVDIKDSLRVYNAKHIDICFVHAVADSKDLKQRLKGVMRSVENARQDGTVRFTGITSNRIEILAEALETGRFDVCCAPYNIEHRLGDRLFDTIKRRNIGLITFMSFGGGILLDPGWNPEKRVKLTFHDPLRFLLSRKEIDSTLIGTNKPQHLSQLLDYANKMFKKGRIKMTNKEAESAQRAMRSVLGEGFCRGCKYCINDPAQHKLEIDRILRLKAFATAYKYPGHARQQYQGMGIDNAPGCFKNAAHPDWECPYGLDIEKELREAHALFSGSPAKQPLKRPLKIRLIPRRRLGRTGLEVSVVSLGGGAFNKDLSPEAVWNVVSSALPWGVNLLETAQEYGEEKFSLSIRKAKEQGNDLILCSKSVAPTYDEMKQAITESLSKLRVKHIHIYQFQTVMSAEDFRRRTEGGALKALKEAKEAGKITAIGASSHKPDALIEMIISGELDVVEVPYSIGQHASKDVLAAAKKHDVGVLGIMTLGGGVLVDRDKESPYANDMTAANALRFALSDKRVHSALVGMGSPEHVNDNLSAVSEKPTLNRLEEGRVEKRAKSILGENFCRSCKACMPCDVFGWGFSIDNFFRFHTAATTYGYPQYKDEYRKLAVHADACTACGRCEPRCPYGVPIIARLRQVHEDLGNGLVTNRSNLPEHILKNANEYLAMKIRAFGEERDFKGGVAFIDAQMKFFWDNVLLLKSKAEFIRELGEYDAAIDILEYLISTGQPAEDVNFLLGRCHFEKREYNKALQMFTEHLRHCDAEEARSRTSCFIALCCQMLRKPRLMKSVLARVKEPAQLFREGFRHLRESKEYKDGIRFGLEQLKEYPDSAVLHHHLGEFHMELEEYDKAIEHLSKTVQLDKKMEWTRFSLGKCYFLTRMYEEAEKTLKANLELTSNRLSHFHSWLFLAMAADARNDKRGCGKALQSLKDFKEFIGEEILPPERKFLRRMAGDNRLPVQLKKALRM